MTQLDLDRGANTACLDRAVERAAVAGRGLGGGGARGLERRWVGKHACDVHRRTRNVERVNAQRVQPRDVGVRDDRGCGFDRGFASASRLRTREHAILHHAQANDRECADPDEERRDQQRLTSFTLHGVHSIRRVALAVTTKRGSPRNPSGTGSA